MRCHYKDTICKQKWEVRLQTQISMIIEQNYSVDPLFTKQIMNKSLKTVTLILNP